MTDLDPPELLADLPDVLRMIEHLGQAKRLGDEWREVALALTNTAPDVERMSGLVVDGEAYNVRHEQQWAPCGCRDGLHRFTRDVAWFGRTGWLDDKAEAERRKDKVRGHVVTQLVARTTMEVVVR